MPRPQFSLKTLVDDARAGWTTAMREPKVRRAWFIFAIVATTVSLCAGVGAYFGDPIERIVHPGWREYDSLDQLVSEFEAVYMIQESDLRTAILGPPRRVAVAISSGKRVTMYVEQANRHWLKHDAWLRQLVASGQPETTFHYEFVKNHLVGYWRDDRSVTFPPPYDMFDVALDGKRMQ